MITCILVHLAGQFIGSWCIVMIISTVCLMGALLRLVIPVLIMSRKLAHLPGPPCHRFISGHGDYMKRVVARGKHTIMFDVWLEWAEKYGPLFHYRHYHIHVIPVVYGADSIKKVLHDVDNTRYIFKDSLKFYLGLRMLGNNGMLLSPYNEAWRIKKSILRQFLNPRQVTLYESEILKIINRSLTNLSRLHEQVVDVADLPDSNTPNAVHVDILKLLQTITSDVMGRCLFNKDFGCSSEVQTECSDLAHISSQIARECFCMIADPTRKLPFRKLATKRRTTKNILKIRRTARNIIKEGSPLTDQFVKAFDDIEDIIDDVNSLLFAGQDTTSNILTYALTNIAHSREINKWLREELSPIASDAPWSAINQLPRLDAVVKETLRLYPSAPMTLRTLHKDHDICGYNVPAGSCVWVSPYTAARNPRFWNQPNTFLPQRFMNIKELPKCQYFPFMAGPHECSGKHFALMEVKMVIFHVLKRYSLDLLNKSIPPPQMAITMHPSKKILIRFCPLGWPC